MVEPVTATVIVSLLVCEAVKEGGKYLSKSPRDTFTQLVNTIREKFKTEGTEGLLTRTLIQPTETNNAKLQDELQTQIDADSEFANKLIQLVKQLQTQDKNIDTFVKQNIYNANKEEYERKLTEIYNKNGYPLENKYRRELKDLQNRLRISDDDAKLIEEPKKSELYNLNKEQYERKLTEIYNKNGYPLDNILRKQLKNLQDNLGLADDDVKLIEEPIKSRFYNSNKTKYEQTLKQVYKRHGHPLESHVREELNSYQQELGILNDDAIEIEEPIKKKFYDLNKKEYEKQITNLYNLNGYPLEEEHRQELNVLQDELALSHDDAIAIEEPIKKKFYDLNKDKYSKLVSDLYKENGYPLKDKHHQELNAYWHKLGLSYDDAKLIQRPIEEDYYKLNLHKYNSEIIKEYENHNCNLNLINFEQFQVLRESLGLKDEDTILIEKLIKKYKYFGIIFRGSESEIDYWKLRNLLIEKRWKEANQETKNLILQLANRPKQGYVKHNFLQSIEERDMFIINQLWLIYSDNRFGFTVQAGIFDNANYDEELFAERVGWKRNTNGLLKIFSWKSYEELNFEQNAPVGHLPTWGFQRINFINNKYYCIFWFYICRLFKLEDPLKWIFLSKYFKRLDYLE